jgi:hypothetical protein
MELILIIAFGCTIAVLVWLNSQYSRAIGQLKQLLKEQQQQLASKPKKEPPEWEAQPTSEELQADFDQRVVDGISTRKPW